MSTTANRSTFEGGGHNIPTHRFTTKELLAAKMVTVKFGQSELKKEQIREYFHKTQETYEKVFLTLNSDESFYIQPVHKLRHPLIFYYGHTATFFINKLALAGLTTRINQSFEEMFAVGVDEMSWDDLNSAHYNWPKVQEVTQYRQLVRERVDSLLLSNRFQLRLPLDFQNSTDNDDNAFWWAVLMGIEHERIHLETASVHVRELPLRLVRQVGDFWSPCTVTGEPPASNELVPFPGGEVEVGRRPDDDQYGWDSDYAAQGHTIHVAPFSASKFLVCNREFLEFMKDGGYNTQEWWDEEGWRWVCWRKPTHPWFWVKGEKGTFRLRVQVEEIPLPWDWPVEVNNLEAKAYCNWLGAKTGKKIRLPTEAEWLHLHDHCVGRDLPDWERAPGNINLEYYRSSCPVTMFQQGKLYDVVGNVWQHTETPVYPYPGYRVHPLYDDFSMPTFDGRHFCMKGGAWISTGNEATRNARYAFRRHFFQCIGIRFVEGEPTNEAKFLRNVLGMDPEVDEQADFGFGTPVDRTQPTFGEKLATLAISTFDKHKRPGLDGKRALDLFCGAGRVAYELTRHFPEVIGSDFSARRLQIAFAIRERGMAQYSVVNEQGEREPRTVEASAYQWGPKRENAFFYQADPSNLHAHMNSFDLIVAWNVLENTYNPSAIAPHLMSRLNRGGILLVATHSQWNMEIVQQENMLSATVRLQDGVKDRTTVNYLRAQLQELAEEVPVDTTTLSAVFPTSTRGGKYVTFDVIAFRKK